MPDQSAATLDPVLVHTAQIVTAFVGANYLVEFVFGKPTKRGMVFWMKAVGVAWGTFLPVVFIELFVFLPYAARTVGLTVRQIFQGASERSKTREAGTHGNA